MAKASSGRAQISKSEPFAQTAALGNTRKKSGEVAETLKNRKKLVKKKTVSEV